MRALQARSWEVFLLFIIRHSIQYQYHGAVFLEPLTLRLMPRSDVFQRVRAFDLQVLPSPAGRCDCIDLDGNMSTSLWFNGTCSQLSIVASSQVETLCHNPFGFILTDPGTGTLPSIYPVGIRSTLVPYLSRIDPCHELDALAADVIRETAGQTVSFLCSLAGLISLTFSKVVRRSGEPQLPSVTLAERKGACRDLTVLFMDICRSVGLASRFVSGYTEPCESVTAGELHAWAEVYLPGGGWRGFDPTLGLAVADCHVAAASSPVPAGASPLAGAFRGDSQGSMMTYEVAVQNARN